MLDVEPMSLVEILKLLTKGQLQFHKQMREVVAGSWVTYELKETNVTKAAIEVGKQHSDAVKARVKGHGLGSAHIHTFLAAMEADFYKGPTRA